MEWWGDLVVYMVVVVSKCSLRGFLSRRDLWREVVEERVGLVEVLWGVMGWVAVPRVDLLPLWLRLGSYGTLLVRRKCQLIPRKRWVR